MFHITVKPQYNSITFQHWELLHHDMLNNKSRVEPMASGSPRRLPSLSRKEEKKTPERRLTMVDAAVKLDTSGGAGRVVKGGIFKANKITSGTYIFITISSRYTCMWTYRFKCPVMLVCISMEGFFFVVLSFFFLVKGMINGFQTGG